MEPRILWSLNYQQRGALEPFVVRTSDADDYTPSNEKVLTLPTPPLDLVFDDNIFDSVKDAWLKIVGEEGEKTGFLVFDNGESAIAADQEED